MTTTYIMENPKDTEIHALQEYVNMLEDELNEKNKMIAELKEKIKTMEAGINAMVDENAALLKENADCSNC